MGNYQSSPGFDDLPRKVGQDWNMRFRDPRYLIEHREIWAPEDISGNAKKFLVCRCFKSELFPLCDFSHGVMQMQGANIGPALFEVRKTAGYEPGWWEAGLKGWWSTPVEWGWNGASAKANNIKMADAMEYMYKVNVNTNNYPYYHHMIETFPTTVPEKIVKVCRCWQSKRFPVCDDTHKQLIEAGDPVGPYVAVIRRANGGKGLKNVSALLSGAAEKTSNKMTKGALLMATAATAGVATLFAKKEQKNETA